VIVFTNTRHAADQLARHLERRGHRIASLHGSDNQMQRERAVNDLKRGRVQILVTTDVASRGIPMDGISHVVNFDVPHRPEDYLHRIGRTTQDHATGDASTLMSPEEQLDLAAIERFLGRSVPRVMLPDFDYRMRSNEIKQAVSSPKSPPRLASKPMPKPVTKPIPKAIGRTAAKPAARPAAKGTLRPARPARPVARKNGPRAVPSTSRRSETRGRAR